MSMVDGLGMFRIATAHTNTTHNQQAKRYVQDAAIRKLRSCSLKPAKPNFRLGIFGFFYGSGTGTTFLQRRHVLSFITRTTPSSTVSTLTAFIILLLSGRIPTLSRTTVCICGASPNNEAFVASAAVPSWISPQTQSRHDRTPRHLPLVLIISYGTMKLRTYMGYQGGFETMQHHRTW
jgi:hypothetical protein